jgi:transglutaminase-like putative cysteine protease
VSEDKEMSRMIVLVCLAAMLVVAGSSALCGDVDVTRYLNASTIPPALLKDADAVVRFDSLSFTSHGIKSATTTLTRVVTVLNPEGRGFGGIALYYDKFRRIKNLEGDLYDAAGVHVRSLENSDIKDNPAIADYSLYEDHRKKTAGLYHSAYPYTVVLTYEIEDKSTIDWPGWEPEWRHASAEHARFVVSVPRTDTVRYWTNAHLLPRILENEDEKIYTWKVDSLEVLDPEPVGPAYGDQFMSVAVAPDTFQCDGVEGSLTSWDGLGKWYGRLWTGRQSLSPKTLADVAKVTASASTPREKVKCLYEYLQSKTRYVSVQLGIGGWQPYEASYVEENGYGDCKALTNFMQALLKAVQIESYPALIHSGSTPVWFSPDFPRSCFNHVILCVPLPHDTLWLECTSQTGPFAHLGSSTERRFALAITPGGGVLLSTPSSRSTDNLQLRHASVSVKPSGAASIAVNTVVAGDQQDYVRHALAKATPRERKEWLMHDIQLSAFEVRNADFSEVGKNALRFGISFTIEMQSFASSAGSRLLFQPNLMERRTYVPPVDTIRKQPIIHDYPYLDIDTVTYKLPEGYAMEAFPKPVELSTDGARYSSSLAYGGQNELLYVRRLEVTATILPKEGYEKYRLFWEAVAKADKAVAALVHK